MTKSVRQLLLLLSGCACVHCHRGRVACRWACAAARFAAQRSALCRMRTERRHLPSPSLCTFCWPHVLSSPALLRPFGRSCPGTSRDLIGSAALCWVPAADAPPRFQPRPALCQGPVRRLPGEHYRRCVHAHTWLRPALTGSSTAAFLTQTVSLDESTTVKFEIWCMPFARLLRIPSSSRRLQGHGRAGALQVARADVLPQRQLRRRRVRHHAACEQCHWWSLHCSKVLTRVPHSRR